MSKLVSLIPSDRCMEQVYKENGKIPFFAKLPLEIRLAVYGFVTSSDTLIYPQQCSENRNKLYYRFDSYDFPVGYHVTKECLDYSRLKTICRQFYHELECSGVFYEVNDFAFYYLKDLYRFLTSISLEKRRHIRSVRIQDPLAEDTIHHDWRLQTPELDAVVALLRDCTQLRRLMLDMIDLKAGASMDNEEWMETPFHTYHAQTLLESINRTARDNNPQVICSEFFWKLPQFRLTMHVRYYLPKYSPDKGQTCEINLCEPEMLVIDLTDMSDLQWLQSTSGQQDGDYFGQRCGPLKEQAFRDLVLETKISVAKYRSQLSLSLSVC